MRRSERRGRNTQVKATGGAGVQEHAGRGARCGSAQGERRERGEAANARGATASPFSLPKRKQMFHVKHFSQKRIRTRRRVHHTSTPAARACRPSPVIEDDPETLSPTPTHPQAEPATPPRSTRSHSVVLRQAARHRRPSALGAQAPPTSYVRRPHHLLPARNRGTHGPARRHVADSRSRGGILSL